MMKQIKVYIDAGADQIEIATELRKINGVERIKFHFDQ